MGDKGKGQDKGKANKKKSTKATKGGLRPHEERARQEGLILKKS